MRTCNKCGVEKPLLEFNRDKTAKLGRSRRCAECSRKRCAEFQATVAQTPEHKAKRRVYNARHRREKRAHYNAIEGRRRAAKKNASPAWANREAIDFAYYAADVIHKVYGGVKPHVDHIVPLQHDLVCGLHVENNLQLMSASANLSKGNRWEV